MRKHFFVLLNSGLCCFVVDGVSLCFCRVVYLRIVMFLVAYQGLICLDLCCVTNCFAVNKVMCILKQGGSGFLESPLLNYVYENRKNEFWGTVRHR